LKAALYLHSGFFVQIILKYFKIYLDSIIIDCRFVKQLGNNKKTIMKKLAILSKSGLTTSQINYLVGKIKRDSKKHGINRKAIINGSVITIDNKVQLWVSMDGKLATGLINSGKFYSFSNAKCTLSEMYVYLNNN